MRRGWSHRVGMTIDNSIGNLGGGSFASTSEKVYCVISVLLDNFVLYNAHKAEMRSAKSRLCGLHSSVRGAVHNAVYSVVHSAVHSSIKLLLGW